MEFELVKYNENLPFKIFMFNAENQEYHLHKEIELIFVLKGNIIYEVKSKKHRLTERDLFLVNSFDMHSVTSEKGENILLVLQLDPLYFNQYCPGFSDFYFEANSALSDTNGSLHKKISSNLAKIMLSLIKLNTGYRLEAVNSASEIALSLVQNCGTERRQHNDSELYKQRRISELLKYIEENYSSEIGLETLSKEMLISTRYISKFFKDNLGIGFVDYINKLRISKSLTHLLGSKKSILDIAIEHGFNDHKAYNRVFKKEFGMTPTEYRINYSKSLTAEGHELQSNYFNDTSSDYFKYLFEFLEKDKGGVESGASINNKLNINADLTKSTNKELIKYWKKLISIERAALCLRSDIQSQISKAQKDLGYEFIRFHGIFSDEMLVYREDSEGNPVYNWYYIDLVFDFFYKVNLKPFIEIGFMPEALASKKQYAPYFWRPNVSYPKSIKKWSNLISEFIRHCIARYGKDEVEKWYFEVWDAPELSNIFWYDSKESFFEFYKETYFAIKKISSKLKVGSPGVLPANNFEWFADFLNYCENNSIILDFAACHIYPTADPQNKTMPREVLSNEQINLSMSDENYLKNSAASFKSILNAAGLSDLDLFVTEWNLSPYTVDYTRDTCFLSSYIVYNILSNIDNMDCLAFWSLSDIMDEGITKDSSFHGGYGLFTRNSIKKPSFNAFNILNKLGNNIVNQGKDYIITSKENSYQILLYNFAYFDELFRTGDKSLLSYHERYNIFESAPAKAANIVLNLEEGKYKITRYRLNRESGSSFDAWIKMGAPEELNSDMYAYLKSKEIPEITVSTEIVKGQFVLSDILPVHGILLIEIEIKTAP
jgi:xylan 1,4-beta-xylosidase